MNNNTFVHKYIRNLINNNDTVVDMTLGNGNDTLFLSKYAKHVYAFDVLQEAIEKSKTKLNNQNNITLIKDNHINIDNYIQQKIKLFIFNLGYLPNSNSKIITQANETLIAFKKAYDLLQNYGYIFITFYIGHVGGKKEFYELDKYIKENNILILEKYKQDKIDSPITYIIKKIQNQ